MGRTEKQLKLLQSIKPSKDWSVGARDLLLSQIRAQGVAQTPNKIAGFRAYAGDTLATVYENSFGILFARPVAMMAALALFITGSASAVIFAEGSTPGDTLYSVKQTKEQIQVAFSTAPESRAQLEVDLLNSRLQEIKTVNERPLSPEQKREQVGALVDSMAEKFSSVTKSLDSIKSYSEPKKAAQIAAYVNQKAGEYEKTLSQTAEREDKPGDIYDEKMASAIDKIDETQTKALEVMVDKKDSVGIPEAEVTAQLADKIEQAQETVEKIKVSIASVKGETEQVMNEQAQEASRVLSEAEGLLVKKDFKVILFKLNQSKEIMQDVSKKLLNAKQQNTQQQEAPKDGVPQEQGSKVRAF